jgi:hypothetical protein
LKKIVPGEISEEDFYLKDRERSGQLQQFQDEELQRPLDEESAQAEKGSAAQLDCLYSKLYNSYK